MRIVPLSNPLNIKSKEFSLQVNLKLNSPSQNEIAGQCPGFVDRFTVQFFLVWIPSQTPTMSVDL